MLTCLMGVTIEILGMRLLSLHASLNFSQLALTCQQFLSLLVDLSLYLDLDFSQLLLFSSKLFFLESDRLVGKVFWID